MPLLEMTGVNKRYGGVRALVDASLSVERAQVHGLLGPNGSGKSTLNKVLTGTVQPDSAHVRLDGDDVAIRRPLDAYRLRIAAVYQQLSLIPQLTVAQNLQLGTEASRGGVVDDRRGRERAAAALEPFLPGLDAGVGLNTEVSRLSPSSRQLVEIAKAVGRDPRILVLDEATASLRRDQVELLFAQIHRLTADGVSVIFVSHRLEEIMTICTHATILRNGHTVAAVAMADTTQEDLVRLMVGEQQSRERDSAAASTEPTPGPEEGRARVLRVQNVTGPGLDSVSLELRAGEVLGLGGLQGQGQSELLHALFGDGGADVKHLEVAGRARTLRSPRAAVSAGFALVPGDRASQGLMMKRPIIENLAIVSLPQRVRAGTFLSMRKEQRTAQAEVDRLRVKIGDLSDPVSSLSGGNQQKVVIGKWLLNDPAVVLLDDPTKGVDIGAKAEIYDIIRKLTAKGVGVILNSSDDEELLELCDRVLVMYEGRIVDHLEGVEITKDSLVASALRVGAGRTAPGIAEEDSDVR